MQYQSTEIRNITKSYRRFIVRGCIIAGLIVFAYATNRYLLLLPFALSCYYIFTAETDDESTAMLLLMLFFSGILKISSETTSLFFGCKIIYLLRACFLGYYKKVNASFLMISMMTVYFCLNMFWCGTNATVRIINIFLWLNVAYVMLFHMIEDRSYIYKNVLFSFGLSCIVAWTGSFLPFLQNEISNVDIYYDPEYGSDISRYTGIFSDPNITTIFIILSMLLCLWLYQHKQINSMLFLVLCCILTGLGIATGSKSCFLLLIVFWIVYFFSRTENNLLKGGLVIVAIMILVTFSATNLYEFYQYRFFGAESGITTGRTDIWETYISALNDGGDASWILGFGINTTDLPNDRAAHNVFLQVIYNTGIIGLVTYVFTWISIIKNFIIDTCMEKGLWVVLNKMIPMFCIIATAFFLDAFFLEEYYFVFAIAISMIPYESYFEENIVCGDRS